MDSFEINKIAGAILFCLLFAFGMRDLAGILVSPNEPEQLAFPVTMPEATESDTKEAAAGDDAAAPSMASMLAEADIAKGEKLFKRCVACHTIDEGGANKIGPNLHGVLEDPKGRAEGFSYSGGLKEKGGNWTYADLDAFLAKPKDYITGTKMAFAGIKKPGDRAAIIMYLRSKGDEDLPLPTE